MTALVVGLGRADRGDDAVGLMVARQLRALVPAGLPPGTRMVETEDPAALLELWPGHHLVVIVDAVRSDQPAGTLHTLEVGATAAPLPVSAWGSTGRGSTHALRLATVVELARALGRLPTRLLLVGVEARSFEHGGPLSTRVAAALGPAVALVTHALMADTLPTGTLPTGTLPTDTRGHPPGGAREVTGHVPRRDR